MSDEASVLQAAYDVAHHTMRHGCDDDGHNDEPCPDQQPHKAKLQNEIRWAIAEAVDNKAVRIWAEVESYLDGAPEQRWADKKLMEARITRDTNKDGARAKLPARNAEEV